MTKITIDEKAARVAWNAIKPSVYELSWSAFHLMLENYEAAKPQPSADSVERVRSGELRLLTPEGIEEQLSKDSRFLHEPLTGNERKLLRDTLALLRPYLRTTEPSKCPDCGASMVTVCSGLEIDARGDASLLCRHSDHCEKPPKPVSGTLELRSAVSAMIGYLSSLKAGEVPQHYLDRLSDHYVPKLAKAAGVEYAE